MRARFLAVAAMALGVTTAGYAQFTNGSFESGDFAGWVTQDLSTPFFPLGVAAGGTVDTFGWGWTNTPTDGAFDAVTGWDGDGPGTIRVAQDVFINGGILQFDYRAAWDKTFGATQDRTFSVTIEEDGGGAELQSDLILTATAGTTEFDTGSMSGSVDVSAFIGQTVRVSFDWFVPEVNTGPAQATLDNVRLIPAPGAFGLLMLAGFAARRRRG